MMGPQIQDIRLTLMELQRQAHINGWNDVKTELARARIALDNAMVLAYGHEGLPVGHEGLPVPQKS